MEKPVFEYRQVKENPKVFTYAEGTLSISYEKSGVDWLSNLRNQWKRGIFFNAIEPELNGVTLTIPSGYAGNFEAKSQNGAVALEDLTLKEVKLDLSNGAVKVNSCAFETLSVTVKNGAVSIEESTADTVTVKSNNGAVLVKAVEAGTVTAETDNGAIKLTDMSVTVFDLKSDNGAVIVERTTAERMSVETDNGYIGVKRVDAQELHLTARNGEIAGELAGSVENYSIDAETHNGSCNLSNSSGGERTLYVRTRNGAIRITFYGN